MAKTTKTPPNAVRTSNHFYTFYLDQLVFNGISGKRGRQSGYFMTKPEMKLALRYIFEGYVLGDIVVNGRAFVYTGCHRIMFDITAECKKNDFFSIGCMTFSRAATIKIARWTGLDSKWVRNYIPEVSTI